MDFKKWIDDEIFNEMIVSGQGSGILIAWQGHIWILNEKDNEDDNKKKMDAISNFIKKNHLYGRFIMTRTFDIYDFASELSALVPDLIAGEYNKEKRTLNLYNHSDTSQSPKSSNLIKKVAQYLKLNSITMFDMDDANIKHGKSTLIGKLSETLFHGTSGKYLKNILKIGLSPGENQNYPKIIENTYDRIFLTNKFDKAAFHATHATHNMYMSRDKGYLPIVIETKIPDPAKLAPDFDVDAISGRNNYKFSTDYNPSVKSSTTDSLKASIQAGIVSYVGRIPASFIVAIYVSTADGWKKINPRVAKQGLDKDEYEWWLRRFGVET